MLETSAMSRVGSRFRRQQSKANFLYYRNAVLFGQSSTTLDKSKDVESEKARSGVGAWFMKRLTQMLKTENFNKSNLPQF